MLARVDDIDFSENLFRVRVVPGKRNKLHTILVLPPGAACIIFGSQRC